MTDTRFLEKRSLHITAMNTELPPFKNGEHNSESASTLDRDITTLSMLFCAMKLAEAFKHFDGNGLSGVYKE